MHRVPAEPGRHAGTDRIPCVVMAFAFARRLRMELEVEDVAPLFACDRVDAFDQSGMAVNNRP